MKGKNILHYRILEKLGAGGMGVVYKAEDTNLKRMVALKFLPKHISANSDEQKRFEIEAQATAALNHPHIATIHAIENNDDEIFIIMEYINGQTLHEKITANNPLPPADCLDIAIQIASGLQAAHEKGIVHRDIKSSNIMITEKGQVKIMDFGLAKVSGSVQITRAGTTVGTIAYMSPEQTGGNPVDHRTDLWSFGIVLYEMLTGSPPFKGDYPQAILYAINNESPPRPDTQQSDITVALSGVIDKCLVRNIEQRYQQAAEILEELRSVGSGSGTDLGIPAPDKGGLRIKRLIPYGLGGFLLLAALFVIRTIYFPPLIEKQYQSIAVLPFKNLLGDPGQIYFADGMTETLISNLAQIRSLRVITRTSVMRYKTDISKPVKEIARELDVDLILDGSVYQDGGRARISVQLIDGGSEKLIWAGKYDRDLREILALHNEVSLAITREVRIVLTEEDEKRLSRAEQVNPAALEVFLQAKYNIGRYTAGIGTRKDLEAAISYYQRAIRIEPGWAEAYAQLASTYHWLASSFAEIQYFPMSKAAAVKAIELDEKNGRAHASLAFVLHNYEWDWDNAAREYRRANELDLNISAWATALFLSSAGFRHEALIWFKRAEEMDPLSEILHQQIALEYLQTGQTDAANRYIRRALELNPESADSYLSLAQIQLYSRQYNQAIESVENALRIDDNDESLARTGNIYARAGKKTIARQICDRLEARKNNATCLTRAELHAGLGQLPQALNLINQAFEARDSDLLFIKSTDLPELLASYPSFQSIMDQINFPDDPFDFKESDFDSRDK